MSRPNANFLKRKSMKLRGVHKLSGGYQEKSR